jgi:phenylalanyl-tRNA synthetase beta chain
MAFTLFPPKSRCPQGHLAPAVARVLAASDLQAVERDFAFVVDADVEALTLVNAAQGADKALIADVRVFDEFIGGSLGEGKKSSPSPCACSPPRQDADRRGDRGGRREDRREGHQGHRGVLRG